jgi:hypothetical protein
MGPSHSFHFVIRTKKEAVEQLKRLPKIMEHSHAYFSVKAAEKRKERERGIRISQSSMQSKRLVRIYMNGARTRQPAWCMLELRNET